MDLRPARRKTFLWLALAINLGLLGFFKYFNFFADQCGGGPGDGRLADAEAGARRRAARGDFVLHVPGARLCDRRVLAARAGARSLLDVGAFNRLLPEPARRAHHARHDSASAGRGRPAVLGGRRAPMPTLLLAWGFFKKLVIADNVRRHRQQVFALQSPEFFVLWAGVFAFGIQIYADFSPTRTSPAAWRSGSASISSRTSITPTSRRVRPSSGAAGTFLSRHGSRDYVFLPVAYRLSDRMTSDRRLLFDAATWLMWAG